MSSDKTDIWVYADWQGMLSPKHIGTLSAHRGKGRKSFSFEYHPEWLKSKPPLLLDLDLGWYPGPQFPAQKENFGAFQDSMPDTWGRTLMRRRQAQRERREDKPIRTLYDIDFLLGVYDGARMGALRFKIDPTGPFLDNDDRTAIPPWSSVRELQYGAGQVESNKVVSDQWLAILMAPGSSLGGARPKANVLDDTGHPWIAKFPSKNDEIDKGLWEYLTYLLATRAGISMAESRVEKVAGDHHTFFTKRFDRTRNGSRLERVHFASAMTMTGNSEDTVRDTPPSYLEIAEFIQFASDSSERDLDQLWRRIVFNIAVSNTDDHLRNHGFILRNDGWRLSPAYDINPSVDKEGLALMIDMDDNTLDVDIAREVGEYFQLNPERMDTIVTEVYAVVSRWQEIATEIGISRSEQEIMKSAFRY